MARHRAPLLADLKQGCQRCRHSGDDVKGSEVSPRRLPQDPVVQRQGRPCSRRATVLRFQTLQAPGLVVHGTPGLAAPAVEGLPGRADPVGGLSDWAARGYRCLGLSGLGDHLVRRVSPPGQR